MVKLLLIYIILVSGSSSITNTTKALHPVKFNSVNISNNGSYSGYISTNETEEFCKSFILQKQDIIAFFKKARIATQREYAHDLTASNCYVGGEFITASGMKGNWKIDRARRGYVAFNNGGNTRYYYCLKCKNTLYYEACDIDCIHNQ